MDTHRCTDSNRIFTVRSNLVRHMRTSCPAKKTPTLGEGKTKCPDCNKEFAQRRYMMDHRKNCTVRLKVAPQDQQQRTCPDCDKVFSARKHMLAHNKFSCIGKRTLMQSVVPSNPTQQEHMMPSTSTDTRVPYQPEGPAMPSPVPCTCPWCNKEFCVFENLQKHKLFTCPERNIRISCEGCKERVERCRMQLHRTECLAVKSATVQNGTVHNRSGIKLRREDGVWESQSAFNSMLTNYTVENTEEVHDPKVFLESKRRILRDIIKKDLQQKHSIKINLSLRTITENTEGETTKWAFRIVNKEVFMDTEDDEILSEMFDNIIKKFSEKLLDGSGCRISNIEDLELRTNRFIPLRGSSYIKLPKDILTKNTVINPQSNDKNCFRYSVCINQALKERNNF
jgi:hypothetical protein